MPSRRAVLRALLQPRQFDSTQIFAEGKDPFMGLDGRDRALAERLYRGVLQNLRLLDHLIDRSKRLKRDRTPEPLIWLVRIALYEHTWMGGTPDYAIGQQAVEQARELGGEAGARFLNAMVRRLLPAIPGSPEGLRELLAREEPDLPPEIRYSMPDDIVKALAQGYGDAAIGEVLRGLSAEEPRVWLRVNMLRTETNALVEELAREGVRVERTPWLKSVLKWAPNDEAETRPWESAAWREGKLTVQDAGAMIAVKALNPIAGEKVLDACAAPGGKTGQIWEMMQGKGRLVAVEVNTMRRRILNETLCRLYGPKNEIEIKSELSSLREGFDAILVDAPCLALGLIRRHPEIRWDHRLKHLPRVAAMQRSILEEAAKHLNPGGRLVWVTCSPTREENEILVDAWLREHTGFERVAFGNDSSIAEIEWLQKSKGTLRTRPDLAPVDAFAISMVRRKP